MSANVETSAFVGRVLGNRWVVGEQLGSGSFGVVHAGIERGTGNAVAVKLLHPQFLHHGETIGRFWNEAEALRRMNHPNVLTLLDVGLSDDGVPYLVTELLTGETLRDLLNREGALPAERAMRLLGPAAHALHHAHLAGIVHRDLKPENIFRVRKDGMGTTKILDFGVAKLLDTQPGKKLSQTGIMIGTMAYSPPEQMQGLPDIDHRADQFGFAALMFEALTGQRPFPHQQPFALFQAVMSGARPRASDIRPELPHAVDVVIARALEADRNKRYRSVEEFYLALTQALTTPAFQGLSTTFTGAAPAPLGAPIAPMPMSSQPSVALPMRPPPAMMSQRIEDVSARFRPIDEESTRSDHALAPVASESITTTMQSGGPVPAQRSAPPSSRPAMTTLAEGASPLSLQQPPPSSVAASVPVPYSMTSSPPASAERPIEAHIPSANAPIPPLPPLPTFDKPKPLKTPRPGWMIVVAVLIALGIIGFLVQHFVLRH